VMVLVDAQAVQPARASDHARACQVEERPRPAWSSALFARYQVNRRLAGS